MEKTSTILLVDDSEDDRELMRFAFNKAGIRNPICEMEGGDEAIAYLSGEGQYADRDRYPLPCLIITDLKMPGTDGFTLLEWIQNRPELTPVPKLVLTSSGLPGDENRARQLGCCAYFVKPSQLDNLVKVVAEMDEDWISEHCPIS
jgi:CheY-like chemotaxis protein